MAKDARGHGSTAAAGTSGRRDLMRQRVAMAPGARFSGRTNLGNQTDTQRTVADLRMRLQGAQGPGHTRTLMQGIKNFFA
jgi:hypothetical protein